MKIEHWTTHAIEKVFPQTEKPARAWSSIMLKAAANETVDAQIVIRPCHGMTVERARVRMGDLAGPEGAVIPQHGIEAFWVWYTYVLRNPPHSKDPGSWLRTAPGFFPDAFLEEKEIRIAAQWTQPLWVRIRVPGRTPPGVYRGTITVHCTGHDRSTEELAVPVEVTVWPFALPARTRLMHTEWFEPEVLATYYRVEPWSEQHWQWIEKVAADMALHRQNTILTPLLELVQATESGWGRLSFNFTRLDRWIELFRRHGIETIEGSHLASRVGDWTSPIAWRRFPVHSAHGTIKTTCSRSEMADELFEPLMEQFLTAVREHVKEWIGLASYVQHIADEPIPENVESWKLVAKKVRAWLPGVRIIDAAMCEQIVGALDIRVPQIQEIRADGERHAGEELWSYVCLAPQGHAPNRFLDIESIRNRIIFWISFSLRLKGFLHWGYAHWKSWVPGMAACVDISPWMDATAGSIYAHDRQPLPAGDPHIVYPGRHSICSSIRWETVRKGIEDFELLSMLEEAAEKDGGKTKAGVEAAALIKKIRSDLAHDARVYTRNDRVLLAMRDEAGNLLAMLGTGKHS